MASRGGGRPPGRPLTEVELQHLRLLLELRDRGRSSSADLDERLEDFVFRCREDGCSANSIAAGLGVSTTTVQRWTEHARNRRRG